MEQRDYFLRYKQCASCVFCVDLAEEGYRKCKNSNEDFVARVKDYCPNYIHDSNYPETDLQGNYIGSGYSSNTSSSSNSSSSSGGCYVATAVYGSYDCPQVWTLRRFRDDILSATWYGRAFIRTYYAISPTLVKWFGQTEWFKKIWQHKLDTMVKKLNDEGVENTPYQDKH